MDLKGRTHDLIIMSRDDRDLTRHLCETGALLDIPVLDHIIIARSGYVSFKDEGLM